MVTSGIYGNVKESKNFILALCLHVRKLGRMGDISKAHPALELGATLSLVVALIFVELLRLHWGVWMAEKLDPTCMTLE